MDEKGATTMKVIQKELPQAVWQGLYDVLSADQDLPIGIIGEDGNLRSAADGRQAMRFLADDPERAADVPIAAIEFVAKP